MAPTPVEPLSPRKKFQSAVIWTSIAAVVAVVVFIKAADPATEKKNFYWLAGAVAVIATIVNGLNAWTAWKNCQLPPTA